MMKVLKHFFYRIFSKEKSPEKILEDLNRYIADRYRPRRSRGGGGKRQIILP